MCHSLVTNVSFLLSFYETYSVILLCHSSMTNVSFLTDQCVIPYWPLCRSLPTNVSFRTDQCVIPMCHSVCPTLSFRWSQNVIPLKRCVILWSQNVILDVIPAKSEYVILVWWCVILISAHVIPGGDDVILWSYWGMTAVTLDQYYISGDTNRFASVFCIFRDMACHSLGMTGNDDWPKKEACVVSGKRRVIPGQFLILQLP